ncbi:MAG: GerMN domain-containing protein [Synergistaceae bacterium]|jgi:hypothetical protein|nr:GerMN domain-containing protein [Synergistaceae bacterium]
MRPSERRKWKSDDEPSPREKREMIERGEWEDEDEAPNRAPLVFRILAWSALVVIFFAVGYGVTSLAFKWLDSKSVTPAAENLTPTPEDAASLMVQNQDQDQNQNPAQDQNQNPVQNQNQNQGQSRMPTARSADVAPQGDTQQRQDGSVTVTISIPDGNTFKLKPIQIRGSNALREDIMKQTLAAYMDVMKENQMLSREAQDLNIFQSGEWLYLNMNGDFLESIKTLGTEKSRIMLTGIVKTMADNFDPVNKVKFYIDGKEVRDKKPIDLTSPWGISARS